MTVVHTNASMKRLFKDIKNIYTDTLEESGIYYKHDQNDTMTGYALIIGPSDTVYENGYYFYKFEFPDDYPASPPKVLYYTNDGVVRFHPNFYRNGKVCLSVLNTWKGEGWTSCQTIKSILLILCSLLSNDPLLNEPGITAKHRDFNAYNNIIQYKNLSVSIVGMLNKAQCIYPSPRFNIFKAIVKDHFIANYFKNLLKIQSLAKIQPPITITTTIYDLSINVNYHTLEEVIKKVVLSIKMPEKCIKNINIKKENEKIEIKK
jgi:ubiquitin-protein ligase